MKSGNLKQTVLEVPGNVILCVADHWSSLINSQVFVFYGTFALQANSLF